MKTKNKRNYLKQNGITLIALVVTIVVLLILAGVSLNAIFSENGLIKRAQDAQNKMNQATQNDLDSINSLNEWIDSTVNGTVVGKEGSLLAMYQKAQKENCDNSDGECNDATHLHIGDYVDYKNPTSGTANVTSAESGVYGSDSNGYTTANVTQTYTLSTTKNNINWRVFGIDNETGGLKLIAADPIERDENSGLSVIAGTAVNDPYLYLRGAEGYLHGPTVMNKISAMYLNSTYATKARSVTMNDIDEITGITTEAKIKEVDILGYGTEYNFDKHYTPELWLQIGKKKDETKAITVKGTSTAYAYTINNAEEPTVKITNTRVHDMLFKDVELDTKTRLATGKPYWLASRAVNAGSSSAYFGPGGVLSGGGNTNAVFGGGLFGSTGHGYGRGLAVRPVVILKPDVMATDVVKIEDQSSTWTYVRPVC